MNIDKILRKIVCHWYYFYVASAITMMFHIRDWYSLLVVVTALVGMKSLTEIRWNGIDLLVLLAMTYGLVSFSFSDYRVELFYYGIKKQLVTMFFYFIARSRSFRNDDFIDNFKWPMFVVIVAGIFLYYFPPAWYIDFRYSNIVSEEGTYSFYEHIRMSSFFSHPYFLGYGSCFFIIYIVKRILINNEGTKWHYVMLSLAAFTLIFAQMRIAIAYTLVFLCLVLFYQVFIEKKKGTFVKFLIIMVPVGIALFFILEYVMDENYLDYIHQRTTGNEDNIVEERFNQFSYFTQYISLLGCGLGRFGHAALEYNLPSCADNEYIRLICELGYVGTILIFIPIIYAIFIGFSKLKHTFFPTFALFFFPFSMLGATPLEMDNQHNFMLWYCVGYLVTIGHQKSVRYEKFTSYKCDSTKLLSRKIS